MFFSASLACATQLCLVEDIQGLLSGGIDHIHIDIMDGHNVPNFALSFDVIEQVKQRFPTLIVDAHFMTEKPENYVERSKKCGVDWMVFDPKESADPISLLQTIRSKDMLCGIAVNPDCDVASIQSLLPQCDVVLVMGVKPGANGQAFRRETYEKIKALSLSRKVHAYHYLILVDGGVNLEIARSCMIHEADGLVLGTLAVFNQGISVAEASSRFIQAFHNMNQIKEGE